MREDTRSIEELISSQKPGYSLDELPEPGDFKVLNVANESAIIVRGSDGNLKGFANVCRHRGSLVCLESSGNTRKFMCPYHGWVYDIDGNLTAARNMPDDFDMSEYGLKTVSVDTIHGLMFVCFTDKPPSLEGARKDLAEPMALFDFKNLKVAAHKFYDIPANWKLSIENYQECYHCATAHPEYARMHTLMLDHDKRKRVQGKMLGKMEACGLPDFFVDYIDTKARPGEIGYGYSRTALFDGYLTGSEDGKALAPLLGDLSDYDGGASDFSFGAFSFLLAYSDHVVAYVFAPTDMDNSRCDIYWLVRNDAEAGKDYDVDKLTWLWDITTQADKSIIVNNSKGVHSRYYEPGPFSGMERAEKIYIDWILQELQRE